MVLQALLLTALLFQPSFYSGESLHYELRWSGMKAGEMTLKTERIGDILLIEQTAISTGFVHAIYPMRDIFTSFVNLHNFQPLLFVKEINERKKRKTSSIFFWHSEGVSYYKNRFHPLPESSMDTLSSIYLLRTSLDSLPVDITVHDRGKSYVIRVKKLELDEIIVGDRSITAIRVDPEVVKGKRDKRAEMTIWFSRTPAHVPLKIKFSAGIGSLTATINPYCE